jgi:flagellar motor switch protein FliM
MKKDKTDENLEAIRHRLKKVNVPVIAKLGGTTISLDELIRLQTGDVVKLTTNIERPLDIMVGTKRKFTALPGTKGRNIAISIEDIIEEGSE